MASGNDGARSSVEVGLVDVSVVPLSPELVGRGSTAAFSLALAQRAITTSAIDSPVLLTYGGKTQGANGVGAQFTR
jgi:hypothetical protein